MSENKRFEVETDEGFVISIKDNLTKKYPFSISCESVDDYENLIDEVMNVTVLLNQLWEQTRRFEVYYTDKLNTLKMIDKIVTKTDLNNHTACKSAIKRIDELTNGYGD